MSDTAESQNCEQMKLDVAFEPADCREYGWVTVWWENSPLGRLHATHRTSSAKLGNVRLNAAMCVLDMLAKVHGDDWVKAYRAVEASVQQEITNQLEEILS